MRLNFLCCFFFSVLYFNVPLKKPGVQLQWPSCMTFNTAENLLDQGKEKGQHEDAHSSHRK